MQVSVEESGAIERKLSISVPSEKIDSEIAKRLLDVAKNARVPGFRPGKAPQNVIKKRYAPQVTNEVINETINASYRDALGQEKIIPAGLVSIDPTPYESGKEFQFVATVEVFPKIPSPTLEGKTIEKPMVAVTDEDIMQTLEDIRKRNANFVTKNEKSEKEDRLTIDFEGKIDGEVFENGSADDFVFILGAGQMLAQLDAGLVGLKAGETKTIAFTFPENYGDTEVAGKDVEFTVTVKVVEKPELSALDDDFAKSLGIKDGGIEKMKQEIGISLRRGLDSRMRAVMRDKVMNELYAANDIESPKALVEEEIERSVKAVTEQLIAQGLPTDKIDRNHYAEQAKKRVALGLIAREVIEKSKIEVDAQAIRARIVEMSANYESGEEYVKWHYADPERLKTIEAVVLEDQVIARMLETATVKEQKIPFKTFMNPQPID
ncbi:trigger factor [Candidatus Spongiihabitans sp.]|uniref:trigger factor n=1 Tax=Candidatus Spongiihabitans sp. TaxID=3101308 RepID=UPI003C6EF7B4